MGTEYDPLFSSQVHTQQTKSHPIAELIPGVNLSHREIKYMDGLERLYGHAPPTPQALETIFRHSGWQPDRNRVREALIAANVPANRLQRFEACGGDCCIEYSRSEQRYRFKAFYCGDRFCRPCSNARAQKVRQELMELAKGQRARLVTFTLEATPAPLICRINDLTCSFSKVRQSMIWRSCVDGGAAVMEIKRGSGSGLWHVHLHCIVVGSYLDHDKISEAWRRASGGSYVVDVREIKDHEKGVGYVAAYAGKGFDRSVLTNPADLLECLIALRGRRLFCTFGAWWSADIDGDSEPVRDWRMVGRFGCVVAACLRGDAWARGVLTSLKIVPVVDQGKTFFRRLSDDG